MVRADDVNLTVTRDPAAAVVAAGHPGNVESVYVAGRPRKRHAKLVDVDVPAALERARASSGRLFELVDAPGT